MCVASRKTSTNKSANHRLISAISNSGGVVQLKDLRGKSQTYIIEIFPTAWEGVAARMKKPNGDTYEVFVAMNGQDHLCDCLGYLRHGKCKHVSYIAYAWAMECLPGMNRATPTNQADRGEFEIVI